MSAPEHIRTPRPRTRGPGTPGTGTPRPAVVAGVIIVLVVAVVVALLRGNYTPGLLEPDSPEPRGARAVTAVLRDDLGVDVVTARTTAEVVPELEAGATVLVTDPRRLGGEQLDALAAAQAVSGARIVLVQPSFAQLRRLAPDVLPRGTVDEEDATAEAAGCSLDLGAREIRAGALRPDPDGSELLDASLYAAAPDGEATVCFPIGENHVVGHSALSDTVALGSRQPLVNQHAADLDDAALALNLLGGADTLVWYVPSPTDPMGDAPRPSLLEVLPRWLPYAAGWALLAALGALVVFGRRFGPPVSEPLPVQVRADELTVARGTLYRRASDRGHAASVLRSATMSRLAAAYGVARSASPGDLIAVLAGRGADPARLRDVLVTRDVPDDPSLVRLAQDLTVLEKELMRP